MKRLTFKEYKEFVRRVKPLADNEEVKNMNSFIQHGTTTTYQHCIMVARLCFWLNRRFRFKANEKELLTSAMLHDLYLYDWHNEEDRPKGLHGYTHAKRAAQNAIERFPLNKKEYKSIESHMWPLNITKVPKSKEAWILCLSDKIIATLETFKWERFLKRSL